MTGRWFLWMLALGVTAGLACSHWLEASEHTTVVRAQTAGAVAVDDQTCIECHPDPGERLSHTVHRKVLGCQHCHGPGSQHVADPPGHVVNAATLMAMPASAQSEMCLGCHGQKLLGWSSSEHAAAALPCFSCHSDVVHFKTAEQVQAPAAFRRQAGFCNQCHRTDTLGFQQIFRHPVPEGAMDCSDCHAVHGKLERGLTLDEGGSCGHCHRRQVQPHVFQHEALREGCTTCHQAHGSPQRALLSEPANTVCLKCHFQAGFPVIEGVDHTTLLARGALCYDCHIDVHGSNTDPSLLGRLR